MTKILVEMFHQYYMHSDVYIRLQILFELPEDFFLFFSSPPSPGPARSRGSVRNAPPPPPSVPSRPAPGAPGSGGTRGPMRPGPSPRSSPTPLHPGNIQQAANMVGMAQSAYNAALQAPLIPA